MEMFFARWRSSTLCTKVGPLPPLEIRPNVATVRKGEASAFVRGLFPASCTHVGAAFVGTSFMWGGGASNLENGNETFFFLFPFL